MMTDYEKEYFEWLCNFICDEEYENINRQRSYSNLLKHLHMRIFEPVVPRDEHRCVDGESLRIRFCNEMGYYPEIQGELTCGRPCSIFEMMLALALRCEETIMDDDDYGNRTGQWFWMMLVNLGLGHMSNVNYDEAAVDDILDRFINREYSPYGDGGLFTVKNPRQDMRSVEIWYQMCWYLSENF